MLYRLAALFELAALIDPTAVESLASKIAVSSKQGVASAVLKVQAEDALLRRQEIEDELVRLDAWWHDPTKELSEQVVTLLDTPISGIETWAECSEHATSRGKRHSFFSCYI
jgi:hypothetical protein